MTRETLGWIRECVAAWRADKNYGDDFAGWMFHNIEDADALLAAAPEPKGPPPDAVAMERAITAGARECAKYQHGPGYEGYETGHREIAEPIVRAAFEAAQEGGPDES